ncbi:hypothetical protein [Streptomyces formicae]|uniref:Nucleopolyhedrovirus P10 family protein n=1 Tax=Streptomyces formicae TaxID=1616117 RepID=A0ABY3WX31_9ACTN|nr:hypothetical protein [Streptomyces formicae]UNM14333.1 hypothetical protein J4032_25270 [Streptomyces formicae]
MTTADGWAGTVRARLGLGRILPLGTAADGAWLTERAARSVLHAAAAREVRGAVLGRLRIGLADPGLAAEPVVPPPPGALPPGLLRIEADFAAVPDEPIPVLAERLRAALHTAAVERLDLAVTEIDLRVTALLDASPGPEPEPDAGKPPAEVAAAAARGELGRAAAAVPGVARLTDVLGVAVRVAESSVRVECATARGHRPLTVALAVREAVAPLLAEPVPVAVLITDVPV